MTRTINYLKESKTARWGILILVSFVMMANYYFYDALSSIKSTLTSQLGFSNSDYGLVISFYAVPNLIMTFVGGILLDRIGIRRTGTLFVAFMALGAMLTALGASEFAQQTPVLKNFSPLVLMILGRLLFGLGAETSIVVTNKIMVKWFKGKNLALAFAVNVSIARLGTALALIFSPWFIEAATGWNTAIWFAALFVLSGFLAFLVYNMYDKKFDGLEAQTEASSAKSLVEDDEKIDLAQVKQLFSNTTFWYISLLCVTFYSAVFPFMSYAPDLLVNKFGMSEQMSGLSMSLLPFGTMVVTPFLGYFIDKWGKAATMMIIGSVLLLVVHLIFALTQVWPYIPIALLGIAFSLVPAALWPSVAKLVKDSQLGTAYGLMGAVQNIGLAIFPMLAGYILDISNPTVTSELVAAGKASYDYTITMLMFAGLGLVGLLFSFLLLRADRKYQTGLE